VPENNSSCEEHNNFIHSYMFTIVKYCTHITELIKGSSNYSKSSMITDIFVWLIHISTKMYKSQYVIKLVVFNYVTVKWHTESLH